MTYQHKEVPFPSRVEEFYGYGLEDVKLARDLLSRGCRVEAVGVLRTAMTAFELSGDDALVRQTDVAISYIQANLISMAQMTMDKII